MGMGRLEPFEPRSDIRNRLIPASPAHVFAALSDPARVARWWGPDGFRNSIHRFDFQVGGSWRLTMHGPDGKDYPNESRFARIEPGRLLEIEHLGGHHFVLSLELEAVTEGTVVHWRQTFDSIEHYERIRDFVAGANAQNLERLAVEVREGAERSGPARAGLFVYALDPPRVADFYGLVAGMQRLVASDERIVLQSPDIQLVVLRIPPAQAAGIEVTLPPRQREQTALRFFVTVPSLAAARLTAAELGGEVFTDTWAGPGFVACNGMDPEGNVLQLRQWQ